MTMFICLSTLFFYQVIYYIIYDIFGRTILPFIETDISKKNINECFSDNLWDKCLSLPHFLFFNDALVTLTTEAHYPVTPYTAPHPPARPRSGPPARGHRPRVASSALCLSSSLALPGLNTGSPPTRPDHDINRGFHILLHHLQQTCGNAITKTWLFIIIILFFYIMCCLISAFHTFLVPINTCSPRLGVRPPSVRLEHSSSLPAPVGTGNDQTSTIFAK